MAFGGCSFEFTDETDATTDTTTDPPTSTDAAPAAANTSDTTPDGLHAEPDVTDGQIGSTGSTLEEDIQTQHGVDQGVEVTPALDTLLAMGAGRSAAEAALQAANGDLEQAAAALFDLQDVAEGW